MISTRDCHISRYEVTPTICMIDLQLLIITHSKSSQFYKLDYRFLVTPCIAGLGIFWTKKKVENGWGQTLNLGKKNTPPEITLSRNAHTSHEMLTPPMNL